jgi:hypothetical protein
MRYLILLLSLALSACAAPPRPGNSNIAIETLSRGQVLTGAECTVNTAAGSWRVISPGSAPVGSAAGDLRVACNKNGYRTSEVIYRPYYGGSNSSFGIGIGGGSGNVGVGLGMGFPIGAGGGATYPSRIAVEMNPL